MCIKKVRIMFTVVALGPVTYYTNGTGSQLTTVNKKRIIGSQAITFHALSLNRKNDNAVSACQPLLLISNKFLVWFLSVSYNLNRDQFSNYRLNFYCSRRISWMRICVISTCLQQWTMSNHAMTSLSTDPPTVVLYVLKSIAICSKKHILGT